VTICNLCKARYLLDFDAEKKHFECLCVTGPPNKEYSHYYICNSKHSHFDIKKPFNGTQQDCKICKKVLSAKTKKEAEIIFKDFHDLITGKLGENSDENNLGKLNVFAGVKEFPVRVKCASLAWHTMRSALNKEDKKVTTE
ncbi:MAG: hypothetical protein IH819_07230, partial [Bacteroidetes bacterium]|nr:hypothetical protein [Bacteroidota bacterium]